MTAAVPPSLAGVGITAVGVAVMRALESERADGLLDDPYAALFVTAAEAEFTGPDGAASWAGVLELAGRFRDGRIVAVRYFDDYVSSAIARGCRQVVNLGAGLDTRSLRLGGDAGVRFFELDLPAMFEFKERVLAGHLPQRGAGPQRVVVASDLTADWFADLVAAGYDPAEPTAWLEEGVLAFLPPAAAAAVLDTVTDVATPGSTFAKAAKTSPGAGGSSADRETYRALRTYVGESDAPSSGVSGTDRDNTYRLAEQGWELDVVGHAELAARLGRDAPPGPDAMEYVTAARG